MNVITLHKKDLAAGHQALKTAIEKYGQGSNEMWEIKNRISKYEISYGQSANLAVNGFSIGKGFESFEDAHMFFYQHLTAPYRPEKKLPEGIANLDDEIILENNEETTS